MKPQIHLTSNSLVFEQLSILTHQPLCIKYQVPSLWWLVLFKTQWTLCNRRIRWRISGFPGWKKKQSVGSKWWSKFTFPRNPCDLKHCNMYITDIFRMIPQMDHHDHFRMTIQLSHFLAAPQGEGVRGDVEQWGDGHSTVWSWCFKWSLKNHEDWIEDPWRSFNLEGNVFMFIDVHLLQWWVMWCCTYVLDVSFSSLKSNPSKNKISRKATRLGPLTWFSELRHDNQAVVSSGWKFAILNLEGILWWYEIWKTLATPPNVICTGNLGKHIQKRRFPEVVFST